MKIQMERQGRLLHQDWDRYDTRHAVFAPARMTTAELEAGYWRAYRDFYRWSSIWRGSAAHDDLRDRMRHLAYASGWKKLEPMWDVLIRSRNIRRALPALEAVLSAFGGRRPAPPGTPGNPGICPGTFDGSGVTDPGRGAQNPEGRRDALRGPTEDVLDRR